LQLILQHFACDVIFDIPRDHVLLRVKNNNDINILIWLCAGGLKIIIIIIIIATSDICFDTWWGSV